MNSSRFLTYMFNKIITDKEIPLIWKKHMIQPIHKDDSEFRPISLIEKTRKLFEKLIFSKFEHSTLNHALTLDTRLRHSDVEGICVTLDFSKAYDSVYRKRLYEKLMIKKKFSREDTILIAALIENNESYTEEKKLLRWIFKPNKSKNLKNLKKNIKYIKNKIQGNEFKAKYNRWQKENLRFNSQIFYSFENLRQYNFKRIPTTRFKSFLDIIRPEHKRENIIEILIKFIQHNIGHPTNGVNIGLINPQDII
ncbi:hypothetical protein CWI38_1516p0010 [Hamiltosporidium tvaerminnensis]|uniref:Reverse transcriptase domain-containing protein n=1 Tax=Hamiltosporidium tvaerminnensis TaxID=1176355 RepID=A0A4Q9LQR8_9MICR|nr:hypothetical protein CWI38_1516p0010 [Hamiltosporidium tvaerminnensis]